MNLQSTSASPANRRFTVLVVDDEPVNRLLLKRYLSLKDYAVVEAEDGMSALKSLESAMPDIILLDVMMPHMSGYEVCQRIRERFSHHELPIMMLTAKSQTKDVLTGFKAGANDYLTKPFNQDELLVRIETHLRLAKITTAYIRFVPREFLDLLGYDSIVDVRLGDQVHRQMTVLFMDVRNFTGISEGMPPRENFEFLNEVLGRLSPLVRQYNGFIDKYIGDAMMALFPGRADDALQAGVEMLKAVFDFNAQAHTMSYPQVRIGIGLHTGDVILGTVGEFARMETTVIADAVNTASRMEGLTKEYGVDLLISKATLEHLDDASQFHSRMLDRVQVKGKKLPVAVYEVFDADPPKIFEGKRLTKTDFEAGVNSFQKEAYADAIQHLAKVLTQDPNDRTARYYLSRALQAGG